MNHQFRGHFGRAGTCQARVAALFCIASLAGCAGTPTSGSPASVGTAQEALLDGDTERASLEAKLALQDDPLDSEAHFVLACALAEEGEVDQSIVGFRRARTVDPANYVAAFNEGTMLLRREEPIPAARMFEAALASRPDHVPSYVNLGKAYYLAGLPELAAASYEKALSIDPTSAIALHNLVTLLEGAGLFEAAESYRRQVDALDAGEADAFAEDALDAPKETPAVQDSPNEAPTADQDAAKEQPPPPQGGPPIDIAGLRELLSDLPNVRAELSAGRLTVTGWTRGDSDRALLDRVLLEYPDVRDLTTDDLGDPQRMIDVDATIFFLITIDSETAGFNFLRLVHFSFDYFSNSNDRAGTGFAAPGTIGDVSGTAQSGWQVAASVDYDVTIANAVDERVSILARPHLTTLSGTPATFLAGGEYVFQVSGNISGDIKPYPFGTTLDVTPTLLRTPGEDGRPRVHLKVEAGRTSILELLTQLEDTDTGSGSVVFDKVNVTGEAVLDTDQTLIMSGLSQKERRSGRSGVPYLRSIPIIKYFFSTATTVEVDTSVIILLTPRDPGFHDEQNRAALERFVEERRAFVAARRGTEEDFQRFAERYPDWRAIPPNRFASHFFLLANSELYRVVSGDELTENDIEFDILGTRMRP